MMQNAEKMTETLANWYSSESTQGELFNEYQHDKVWMIFKNVCIFVLWMKLATSSIKVKNTKGEQQTF